MLRKIADLAGVFYLPIVLRKIADLAGVTGPPWPHGMLNPSNDAQVSKLQESVLANHVCMEGSTLCVVLCLVTPDLQVLL